MPSTGNSDAELVRSIQSGDVSGLGALLSRHEAGMKAVAYSLLGYGPDAEDAVQDAMLTALRRIGDVRDPAAVGSWLRMVVRNNCRSRLRATRPLLFGEPAALPLPATEPSPEDLLEDTALRDWVWHAVGELSEPVRLVTLLRYFTDVTSYDQIAALCGIPVGTVRSRLSQARARLTEALRNTTELAYDDAAEVNNAWRREAEEIIAASRRGEFARAVQEYWWPEADFVLPDGQRVPGRDFLVRAMEKDLADGVRQRIRHVAASGDVMVWEADLFSPQENPEHCPPGVVWLHHLRQGRIRRLRLFHPQPARPTG
ncbi:RNA polymerase sigma factor [Plantactinospora soyae]|uniref:RNA polymerase sigma-70 factor (ECF subfamily) n=1 Tax=Plantactinospora soyae TaxID=1544732 RepID=A0A927M9Z6_9ACTN|nr:sigma-70 family RNA polymerase sigma factor [Plantactinospora soyae]MBE1490674.1 RNA polymerase sigma-70 factor (ECF subfamily) [Plantactinospora soyae]